LADKGGQDVLLPHAVLYLLHQNKYDAIAHKVKVLKVNACQSGEFPIMVDEIDDQDESPHVNMSETREEVQDNSPAFDDDLNFDADNIEIEGSDHVFMALVHPVNPQHFIHDLSMVFRHLAEAFTKT
jgi:hypothetical protein